MGYRTLIVGVVGAALWAPGAVLADERAMTPAAAAEEGYAGLEDFQLRRNIVELGGYYDFLSESDASEADGPSQELQPAGADGGSAGGYVNFGGPGTSTFLGSIPEAPDNSSIELGFDWRADVRESDIQDYRRMGRSLTGGDIDRIGVRADLTALLRRETVDEEAATAWRLTGMLGSTSLSLLPDDASPWMAGDGGFLWDVGVGWSNGPMSVSAGYQSAYGAGDDSESRSALAVLSLGADYAVLPGLSVFGELNMIDSSLEERSATGFGAVVVVGTGVSF